MTFAPFGEWLPDQPDFQNPGATTIKNVIPATAQSYRPMPSPNVYSGALTNPCLGSISAQDFSGNFQIFAGDKSRLYRLLKGTQTWVDVSKSVGGPYSAGVDSPNWSFCTFGLRLIATNYTDAVQTFLLGTDTAFSDLSAAPKAKFCAVIRDFLMMASTREAGLEKRRVWWSAIGDPTSWPTPGTTPAITVQSDFQDLEAGDLGVITGIIGGAGLTGADGAVFLEQGIFRVAYVGSPDIFSFTIAEGASGTQAPLSIVLRRMPLMFGNRQVAYYLGEDGFYGFDGANAMPIGSQKVDRFFFNDLDQNYLTNVCGVADPLNKLVFWAYMGPQSNGFYNRLLVYNWDIGRWSYVDLSPTPAEFLCRTISLGWTLDQLDVFGTIDQLPFPLDSRVWLGGYPLIGMFDTNHKLNYFMNGATTMAATVETSESQPFPGRRGKIVSARPIVDGGAPSVSVGHRDRITDSVTYEAAIPVNVIGECPQRTTGRYVRYQLTLPANSGFNHLQGIDWQGKPEGRLR